MTTKKISAWVNHDKLQKKGYTIVSPDRSVGLVRPETEP